MRLRHWAWIFAGLAAWAALVLLWATTPSVCELPAARGSAHCR